MSKVKLSLEQFKVELIKLARESHSTAGCIDDCLPDEFERFFEWYNRGATVAAILAKIEQQLNDIEY